MQAITENLMVGQEGKSSEIGFQHKVKSAVDKASENVETNLQKISGMEKL